MGVDWRLSDYNTMVLYPSKEMNTTVAVSLLAIEGFYSHLGFRTCESLRVLTAREKTVQSDEWKRERKRLNATYMMIIWCV